MFPKDIIEKIKLPFRKDKELYYSFYRMLGFYPRNIEFYRQALLHKSLSIRGEKGLINNERLEFLGDAVLDAIVGDIVFRHFQGKREGFLTNTRSKIVQRESLNKIALEIGIDKLLKSSTHSPSHNSYMCGNAFEALVGAIYLDRGYDCCMQFMAHRILQRLIDIDKVAYREVNFKSKLIEWGQKNKVGIDFKLVEQTTEGASSPVFETLIFIENVKCCKGKGYSKKESQQLAAKDTLHQLKRDSALLNRIFEAKARRTAMEEEPRALVPDLPKEEKADAEPRNNRGTRRIGNAKVLAQVLIQQEPAAKDESPEFDLSSITFTPKKLSKEEVVAQAEEEAFLNK